MLKILIEAVQDAIAYARLAFIYRLSDDVEVMIHSNDLDSRDKRIYVSLYFPELDNDATIDHVGTFDQANAELITFMQTLGDSPSILSTWLLI